MDKEYSSAQVFAQNTSFLNHPLLSSSYIGPSSVVHIHSVSYNYMSQINYLKSHFGVELRVIKKNIDQQRW